MPPTNKLTERTIELAAGAPGQGKTLYVRAATADEPRVLAWDPMRELDGELVRTPEELLEAIRALGSSPMHLRYTARLGFRGARREKLRDHFEAFCIGARAWGSCAVLVDELATVSYAGKAPEEWGRVVRESRHYRLKVYATTTRPAESDKTIYGLASRVVVFHLTRATDRLAIAHDVGISPELLEGLEPLHFIETNGRGHVQRGRVIIPTA